MMQSVDPKELDTKARYQQSHRL